MTTTKDPASTDIAAAEPHDPANIEIVKYVTQLTPAIAAALPKHMDADRIARLALTLVRQSEVAAQKARKPENSLAVCSPESFAGALLTASALGLEPGISGEAYLVPYKRECTLIIGYQGLAKLFWQHPLAKHLDAHAVHANDSFDYAYGIAQYLRHKPAAGDRGEITHYYAVAELSTGASRFVVLTVEETKVLRGGKQGPSGDIPDPMHWMERKTALRQLMKLLPKSPQISAALAVDEHRGTTLVSEGVPQALFAGDGIAELPPSIADEVRGQHLADQTERVTADDLTANAQSFDERLASMVTAFADTHGVTAAQLEAKIGRPLAAWKDADVAAMGVVFKRLSRGMKTVDEEFPAAAAESAGDGGQGELVPDPTQNCPTCGNPPGHCDLAFHAEVNIPPRDAS